MKLTMIGISGSGKTSFMSGLYQKLESGATEAVPFQIRARRMDSVTVLDGPLPPFEAGMAPTFIAENGWPEGTQQTTQWVFELMRDQTTVSYFEWIDYRGGILTGLFSRGDRAAQQKELDELLKHVADSNAVLVFLDAFAFTVTSNLEEARHRVGVPTITRIFDEYSRRFPTRALTCLFVLSKACVVAAEWKKNDYAPLLKRAKDVADPFLQVRKRYPAWDCGFIPVSVVGEGNVKRSIEITGNVRAPYKVTDDIIGFPEPMNVEHALYYCLGKTLGRMAETAEVTIDGLDPIIAEHERRRWWKPAKNPDREAWALFRSAYDSVRLLRQIQPHIGSLCAAAMQRVHEA